MNDRAQQLYQQIILDHNKRPRNCHKPELFNCHAEGFNPLCGDHVWIYAQIDEDKCIRDIAFEGEGCALCKASASLMTTVLKNKSTSESSELIAGFTTLLKSGEAPAAAAPKLGSLAVFGTIWQYPARVKCVSLAWHAAGEAILSAPKPAKNIASS